MAFPADPLDVMVELELDSVWTDVTGYVYTRAPITIRRGRPDEGTGMDPSECTLMFNNRDGRFSSRNPSSPYFGVLGRNTPVRLSALLGGTRLVVPALGAYMSAPDSAGLSITGDIDIRIDMRAADWTVPGRFGGKGSLSYILDGNSSGQLILFWSADGAIQLSATSTAALPRTAGRQTVRATLDVNNGAGGRTITFYTGTSVDGPWTQLGDPVVQAGVTSIFDGTSTLRTSDNRSDIEVYGLKVLEGIGGTERANPDFTAQAEGATSFVDAAGNTWTMTGAPTITSRRYRFHGEVPAWPPRWDISGKDIWVPVAAAGITRRLGQGASPLQSALRRGIPAESGLVAYWPLEDAEGSTQLASAVAGAPAMAITGSPELASDDRVKGSTQLPALTGATFVGTVPAATAGTIQARLVVAPALAGEVDGAIIMRLYTTGTVYTWDVVYSAAGGGAFSLVGRDSFGVALVTSLTTHTAVNGNLYQASIELTTSGGNVAWVITTVDIDTDVGASRGGSIAGTVGRAGGVSINTLANLTDTVVGHVHVRSSLATNPYGFENYVRGWVPETPGRRIQRLCSEEGIPFVARGLLGPSSGSAVGAYQGMGPQAPLKLLDLLSEAATTDLGLLIEPRDSLGLAYRPRETLYAQPAALALAYGALSNLEPVDDDQAVRNDITVSREGGSSARQVLETGPLSILAPPDGVGVYDEATPLNIATDAALDRQASWRLHLGTVDEARYPVITLALETSSFAASIELTSNALDLDVGDLITISDPPAWLPPDSIRQIAQGFTEVLEPFAWTIEINCSPASPWDVAVLNDSETRLDSETTTLDEDLTTTETDVTVAVEAGSAPWVTTAANPGEFPFDVVVGGEVMTVTACVGATSPQTFTVTRSVNGVVKTHSTGAQVRLARPVFLAL